MTDTETVETPDGRVLAFCEWGNPDGVPLFFLHGTPGSRYLRSVTGVYERQGIRVFTYDRPGYGRSTRRQDRRVRDAVDDVQVIADQMRVEEFAVVGVSGGGPHALAIAAGLRGRVTRCATVVGLGPYDARDLDFFEGMSPEDVKEWNTVLRGEEYNDGAFYRETLAWIDSLSSSTDLPVHIRDMLVEELTEGLAPGPGGMFDDYSALSRPWGVDLGTVVCPVTIMVAKDDTSVPPGHGRWLANHLPQAQLVSVAGRHLDPREEQEEQLLAWASQAPGS